MSHRPRWWMEATLGIMNNFSGRAPISSVVIGASAMKNAMYCIASSQYACLLRIRLYIHLRDAHILSTASLEVVHVVVFLVSGTDLCQSLCAGCTLQ